MSFSFSIVLSVFSLHILQAKGNWVNLLADEACEGKQNGSSKSCCPYSWIAHLVVVWWCTTLWIKIYKMLLKYIEADECWQIERNIPYHNKGENIIVASTDI